MHHNILLWTAIPLAVLLSVSCIKENLDKTASSPDLELVGEPVRFVPSLSEFLGGGTTTKVTTNHTDGSFNDADQLTVFREYWDEDSMKFVNADSYRVYEYEYWSGLGWVVNEGDTGKEGTTFTQDEDDALVWENGRTIRFRGYSRSNLLGVINDSRNYYYPDYCISNWVNSVGPSTDVPLVLEHLGCRIAVSVKNEGNQLHKLEICTDPADYMREDNAGTHTEDESDNVDAETAKARADTVRTIYNRMCMPSGVNMSTGRLYAMQKEYYDNNPSTLKKVDDEDQSAAHISFGTLDSSQVRTTVQRPVFTKPIKNVCYLISIPYDFSSHSDIQGDRLVLPPYTRFRVYLYDVNDGDAAATSEYEKTYHILSLSDIKSSGSQVFPDGLELKTGYSYWFDVGYRNGYLSISLRDNLSWSRQDEQTITGTDQKQARPDSTYNWWVTTMNDAGTEALSTNDFNPEFTIDDASKFTSFIKLVNGTATDRTGTEMQSAYTSVDETKVLGWYKSITEENDTLWCRINKVNTSIFTDSVKYIFYDRYYPQDGDVPAHLKEDYLHSAYSFYDASVQKSFTLQLTADLDLQDWKLESIGNSKDNSFMGYFDGCAHTLSNLYMKDGYVFGYIKNGGGVGNLTISSKHSTSLVNVCEKGCILGISMKSDSDHPAIVNVVNGDTKVIGCINYGTSPHGLVGTNNKYLMMYGCMQTSTGITGGALCEYDNHLYLLPQDGEKVYWGNFMCNYYDVTKSPDACACKILFSSAYMHYGTQDYRAQEYIRGAKSYVLKAIYDLSLPTGGTASESYYGLAPYRAMNSAIYVYNHLSNLTHECSMHYEQESSGYGNVYPKLVTGVPTEYIDVTQEPN